MNTKIESEDSESDDELNSHGSMSDGDIFDIVSESSEETPNELYMSNMTDIIDCCTFSNEDFYLNKQYELYSKRRITCNCKLIRIFTFNDCLYGLNKYGDLVYMETYYFPSNYWVFSTVPWAPKQIQHVSVTLDGQYLWIQNEKGYLYDVNQNKKMIKCNKRIYGQTVNDYLELHNNQCDIYINKIKIQTIKNVKNAVMDCYHHVHVVYVGDSYDVKLLHHKPYFF